MHFNHVGVPKVYDLPTIAKNGKRWYKTPSGNLYPSVTTVLSHQEKPYLKEWRNMLGDKKADKETKRCADRGEAVHLMTEHYLKNEDNVTKNHKPEHIRMFNQLKPRLNKINNIYAQEIALYSDTIKMAGRVDLVAEYSGIVSIIDFKTSNNNKTDSMIEDYKLQCTAYSIMFEEMYNIPIDQIVIIIAVEKGLVPLVFVEQAANYFEPLTERINTFYKELKD